MVATRKIWLVAIVVMAVGVILVSLNQESSERASIDIKLLGHFKSATGPVTVFEIRNLGKRIIRLNSFCTIYFTNHLGIATNTFIKHNLGYAFLKANEAAILNIPPPLESKTWKFSLTFTVKPKALIAKRNELLLKLFGTPVPEEFIGRISPRITNTVPGFPLAPLPQPPERQ